MLEAAPLAAAGSRHAARVQVLSDPARTPACCCLLEDLANDCRFRLIDPPFDVEPLRLPGHGVRDGDLDVVVAVD